MSLFDQAKGVDLPTLIEVRFSLALRRHGSSYSCRHCPNCGEGSAHSNAVSVFPAQEGIWRWKCFRCRKGGTAIDYLCFALGITATEAASELVAMRGSASTKILFHTVPTLPGNSVRLKEAIGLLRQNALPMEPVVSAYLTARKIPPAVQQEAYARGILRMLPSAPILAYDFLLKFVGEQRLRDAGLWRVGAKWPAIAFRPLLFLLPASTGIECRLIRDPVGDEPKAIRYGRLAHPWFWQGRDKTISICEGAIDMMSKVALGDRGCIMAVPGVDAWKDAWVDRCVAKYPQHAYKICLDYDVAGETATNAIKDAFRRRNVNAVRSKPVCGKDWNEMLMQIA
jgi:hypothetical protein